MTVGQKIKTLRKKFRMTQMELAEKLGVRPTAVSAWERDANKPMMDKLATMAEMFEVSITYFFEVEEYDDSDEYDIPLYGAVSCGEGLVVFETPLEYIATPEDWLKSGEYFYVRASGDSMIGARIYDGDVLFMRKQEEVENGEIAAVAIECDIVLKRVFRSNGHFILQSENPKYPPRIFNPSTDQHIRIIGRLEKLIVNF